MQNTHTHTHIHMHANAHTHTQTRQTELIKSLEAEQVGVDSRLKSINSCSLSTSSRRGLRRDVVHVEGCIY